MSSERRRCDASATRPGWATARVAAARDRQVQLWSAPARRRVPGTPVLVLGHYVERQYATELLADRAGDVGCLLKDRVAGTCEFMDALRRVARRDRARSPGPPETARRDPVGTTAARVRVAIAVRPGTASGRYGHIVERWP